MKSLEISQRIQIYKKRHCCWRNLNVTIFWHWFLTLFKSVYRRKSKQTLVICLAWKQGKITQKCGCPVWLILRIIESAWKTFLDIQVKISVKCLIFRWVLTTLDHSAPLRGKTFSFRVFVCSLFPHTSQIVNVIGSAKTTIINHGIQF